MNDQTSLYAFSTLAQACAALAAFIGAVGLYRLQQLHTEQRAVDEDLYSQTGGLPLTRAQVIARAGELADTNPPIAQNLTLREDLRRRLRWAAIVLLIFETWQMASMLFALLAFYFVAPGPASQAMVCLFTVASVGSALSTIACVIAWAWPWSHGPSARSGWVATAIVAGGLLLAILACLIVRGSSEDGMVVTRGAESWQFLAFIFAALVTLAFVLIDDICQRAWTKMLAHVGVFLFIGYFTLRSPWGRNLLIGVLNAIKIEVH